jgi:hypothetical protein
MPYVGCFISVARVDGFPPFSLIQRTPIAQAIPCEARPNLMIGTLEAESQYDWLSDMCMKIIRTDDFYSCVEDEWAPSYARVHFDNTWGCFRILADLKLIETPVPSTT